MKCVYHRDDDGKVAASVLRNSEYSNKFIGLGEISTDSDDYMSIDYDEGFPFNRITKNEIVFILDFSIEVEEMQKLLEITPNVIWIDHHKTAIAKYDGFETPIHGVRSTKFSGCELTWLFMMETGTVIQNTLIKTLAESFLDLYSERKYGDFPFIVWVAGRHDTWSYDENGIVDKYSKAFSVIDLEPCSSFWVNQIIDVRDMDDMFLSKALSSKVEAVNALIDQFSKEYAERGFAATISGHHVFVANVCSVSFIDSRLFNSIDTSGYDAVGFFSFDGKKWKHSLYSDKIDVSVIATEFGGGGHKGAAGFTSDKLLFEPRLWRDELGIIH